MMDDKDIIFSSEFVVNTTNTFNVQYISNNLEVEIYELHLHPIIKEEYDNPTFKQLLKEKYKQIMCRNFEEDIYTYAC